MCSTSWAGYTEHALLLQRISDATRIIKNHNFYLSHWTVLEIFYTTASVTDQNEPSQD
jgi:hypothetical protein